MLLHIAAYMGLGFVYFEAALHSLVKREYHSACREFVVACLYASIAGLMVFDPSFMLITNTTVMMA